MRGEGAEKFRGGSHRAECTDYLQGCKPLQVFSTTNVHCQSLQLLSRCAPDDHAVALSFARGTGIRADQRASYATDAIHVFRTHIAAVEMAFDAVDILGRAALEGIVQHLVGR